MKTMRARFELLAVNYLHPLPGIQQLLRLQKPRSRSQVGREFVQFFDLTGGEESYAIKINEVGNRVDCAEVLTEEQLSYLLIKDLGLW